MPTYEFGCPAGHSFEKFWLKISDAAAELPCPECGQLATRRVSGGAGLLFKGSGFYITDYGKDGKKTAAGDRKPSAEPKAESKSESPAESKAEPAPGVTKPPPTKRSDTGGSSE